jgi:hypothetical protein
MGSGGSGQSEVRNKQRKSRPVPEEPQRCRLAAGQQAAEGRRTLRRSALPRKPSGGPQAAEAVVRRSTRTTPEAAELAAVEGRHAHAKRAAAVESISHQAEAAPAVRATVATVEVRLQERKCRQFGWSA